MTTSPVTLAIASDHAGYDVKEQIRHALEGRYEIIDLGAHSTESVHYPDFGASMADAIITGRATRGILICGTGIGISIAANRFQGVRAALCTDTTMARLARQHNDANVLALGARISGMEVMMDCVTIFMDTAFEGGRHGTRVAMLDRQGKE